MDWFMLLLLAMVPTVHCWSAVNTNNKYSTNHGRQRNAISPYLDLALCPLREQSWSCARQQSGRILDVWDNELHAQWQKLKVEADRQLNSTLEKRGYSSSQDLTKEKPSTILKKIEIGTNYMKEYLAETMDGFLGREYDYAQNTKNNLNIDEEKINENKESSEAQENNDDDEDEEHEEEEDEEESEYENDEDSEDEKQSNGHDSEFIEIEGSPNENDEELKKPGGFGGNKRKKNKKKKGDIGAQAANLLIVQPLEHQHDDDGHDKIKPIRNKIKPIKQKRRKRKKKGQSDGVIHIVEQEPASDSLSLGLLEHLAGGDETFGFGKRKKQKNKYGRSNGVTRGKKKKKKKAFMKLMYLGTFIKAKIELLLKILGAHLQIKFFAIALIGLLINIARFWIDVKRGGTPQKVVYVEHAHHQHHYEDHGGDDWSEPGGGGYWKRSLQTDLPADSANAVTDSYQPRPQQYDPHIMAYSSHFQRNLK